MLSSLTITTEKEGLSEASVDVVDFYNRENAVIQMFHFRSHSTSVLSETSYRISK